MLVKKRKVEEVSHGGAEDTGLFQPRMEEDYGGYVFSRWTTGGNKCFPEILSFIFLNPWLKKRSCTAPGDRSFDLTP